MNIPSQARLNRKYFKLLSHSAEDTPTPLSERGIECADGWYDLVDSTLSALNKFDGLKIHQIKEKFGLLRIYTSYYNPEIHEILSEAEKASAKICEVCGHTEEVKTSKNGYLRTLCPVCMTDHITKGKSKEDETTSVLHNLLSSEDDIQ